MKIAYVTLATNENFLIGAYNLYKTYLQVNSDIPFYCMILNEVNKTGFEDLPTIIVPDLNAKKKYPKKNGWLNKLNIFLLTEFDIIFWIDADSLMLYNIDDKIKSIALKMKQNNFNIVNYNVTDNRSTTKHIWGGLLAVSPNYDLYIKSVILSKKLKFDEDVLDELKKQKLLYTDDNLCKIIEEISSNAVLHWDNYASKKYWNTEIGKFLFNYYIENKENAINLIKELNKLFDDERQLAKEE